MIYIVWYSTTNADENGIIRAFYDHKAAIQFADAEELKRASEAWDIWFGLMRWRLSDAID